MKSALLRYIARISSLVYARSNLAAVIHSLSLTLVSAYALPIFPLSERSGR